MSSQIFTMNNSELSGLERDDAKMMAVVELLDQMQARGRALREQGSASSQVPVNNADEKEVLEDRKDMGKNLDLSNGVGLFGSSGYPRDCFESVPEDFICGICREIVRNPPNLPCPHLFCQNCLQKMMNSSEKRTECPICRAEFSAGNLSPSSYSIKMISSLPIKCPNHGKGCKWTGTIGLQESILNNHLRNSCLWGGYENCKACGMQFRKDEEKEHLQICPEAERKCEFCDFRGLSKHVFVHKAIGEYSNRPCASMQHCQMNECKTLIPMAGLEHHLKFQCDKVLGICYGCEKQHFMPKHQLLSHIQEHKNDIGWTERWVEETQRPAQIGDLRYLGYETATYNFETGRTVSLICRIVEIVQGPSHSGPISCITECIPGGIRITNSDIYTGPPLAVFLRNYSYKIVSDIALDCLTHHECSHKVIGERKYINQPFYQCRTCCKNPNTGVCAVCAIDCHFGHDLQLSQVSEKSFCDCGDGNMPLVGIKHCKAASRAQIKNIQSDQKSLELSDVSISINIRGNLKIEINISFPNEKRKNPVIHRDEFDIELDEEEEDVVDGFLRNDGWLSRVE
jgi:hypothetical protein